MGSYLQILALITIGIALVWFGYTLFFGHLKLSRTASRPRQKGHKQKSGQPGDSQVCPVCSAVLNKGELVNSHAYPSLSGGRDRFMHIRGCHFCLEKDRPRQCPVCGKSLGVHEFLVSRMFERPRRRNHVHVLGCSRCKRY